MRTLGLPATEVAPDSTNKAAVRTAKYVVHGRLFAFQADVETPAAELVVTAASSDTALIPVTNLVLGGAGANRTLRATGIPNKSGPVTVTLTVSRPPARRPSPSPSTR
jgi:hypothetical protein